MDEFAPGNRNPSGDPLADRKVTAMTWRRRSTAWYSVTLLATVAALVAGVLPADLPRAAAAEQVVFSDGFESGNSWIFYTNGSGGSFGLTSSPVHSGVAALAMSAGADPSQPEIGIAAIRDGLSITEDSSVLSFWYYASGDASYRNISVELHTTSQAYYHLLPDVVVTGRWHQVSIPFTDVSSALAGATVSEIVIKAVTDPAAGTGSVVLDDISVTDGVVPVAQPPSAISAVPAPGATQAAGSRVGLRWHGGPARPRREPGEGRRALPRGSACRGVRAGETPCGVAAILADRERGAEQ